MIFIIRTRRSPISSRPHTLLAVTSVAVVAAAVLLPYTPFGRWFGFVPPPASFLVAIGGLVACYLLLAQGVKQVFFRLQPPGGTAPLSHIRPHLPLIGRS